MRAFMALIMMAVAWPTLVGAQEIPKTDKKREALRQEEREALDSAPSDEVQAVGEVVDAVRREDPRSGAARAWSAWLEDNPQAITDGTAPGYAMIVARQGFEATLDQVDAYVALDPEDNAWVCSDGIDEIEDERNALVRVLETYDPDVAALQDAADEMSDLSAALGTCRAELAGIVEAATASGEAIPDQGPKRGIVAAENPGRAVQPDAAVEEPALDARSLNEVVQRIETIDDWIERLDHLSQVTEDLHAETRSAIDAAGP